MQRPISIGLLSLFFLISVYSSNLVQNETLQITITNSSQSSDSGFLQIEILCIQKCGNNHLCLNICKSDDEKFKLVFVLMSTFFFFGLTICICVLSSRNFFVWLPCHEFHLIKSQLNQIQNGEVLQVVFSQVSNKIIENLNSSSGGNYFYEKGEKQSKIQVKAKVVKRDKFLVQLKLEGKDHLSKFNSYAFILCKEGKIHFWQYKLYKQKTKTGQMYPYLHLIHESRQIDLDGNINGRWYYWRQQNRFGNWKLQRKVKQSQSIGTTAQSLRQFTIKSFKSQILSDNQTQ